LTPGGQVLAFGCLPYTLGWLFAATARSVSLLYISRLLVGIGHAVITTTVYTVEVASKEMRGSYSLYEAVLR
jgi:predicted MFS family arabinose efflux permease